MNDFGKEKWNKIYKNIKQKPSSAAGVLLDQKFLLPKQGHALDLACGLGSNALLLAKQGLQTEAWDISEIAIEKLQNQALDLGLKINARVQNIDQNCFAGKEFDVIAVSRFLDRSICNEIMSALKPGGLLFYQTFTQQKVVQQGPKNPEYLLARNELLLLFSKLKLVFYQENALLGNVCAGLRNEAQYIGQKSIEVGTGL